MKNDAKNAFKSACSFTEGTKNGILLGLTFLVAVLPALIELIKNIPAVGMHANPT